jgi:hypothetical protein
MKRTLVAALLLVCSLAVPAGVAAQSRNAVATAAAPIYLLPDAARTPLRVVAVNTELRVLQDEGDWFKVEFPDPRFGVRTGYVEAKHVRAVAEPAVERVAPAPAPIPDPTPAREPAAAPAPSGASPEPKTTPSSYDPEKTVHVREYTRKDGTKVKAHTRRPPGSGSSRKKN